MDFLNKIIEFLLDKTNKVFHKGLAVVTFLAVLWAVDLCIGYSDVTFKKNKAEAVKIIAEASQLPGLAPNVKEQMQRQYAEVAATNSFKDKVYSLFPAPKYPKLNDITRPAAQVLIKEFNIFYLTISSCGIYILLWIVSLFYNDRGVKGAVEKTLISTVFIVVNFVLVNGMPLISNNKYLSNCYYQLFFAVLYIVGLVYITKNKITTVKNQ